MGVENGDVVFFYDLPKCRRTRKREFHYRKEHAQLTWRGVFPIL